MQSDTSSGGTAMMSSSDMIVAGGSATSGFTVQSKKKATRYCSVVGCHRNKGKHGDILKFFSFPTRDKVQRDLWIKALQRDDVDGKPWQPTKDSLVCGDHFVSGKFSYSKLDPDYCPSIFPTCHKKPKSQSDLARFNRSKSRQRVKEQRESEAVPMELDCLDQTTLEIGCQTLESEFPEPWIRPSDSLVFSCEWEGGNNSVATQVSTTNVTMTSSVATETFHVPTISTETMVDDDLPQPPKEPLSIQDFSDQMFKSFTGVSKNLFNCLSFLLGDKVTRSKRLSKEHKMLIFFIKIKLSLTFTIISGLFGISKHSTSRFFSEVLDALYNFSSEHLVFLDRETINARMPASFRALFPRTRSIIDCSEIEIETPKLLRQRVLCFSNYKQRFTAKFLVSIAPSGEFTFVSKCFGGRATDTEITTNCGFLDLLEKGDLVLADKGFPSIETNLNNNGVILVTPPKKRSNWQFTQQENKAGYECASVRIHVERAIQRLKTFEVLNFVPQHMVKHLDRILIVVSFLCNCQTDLIQKNNDK